MKKIIGIILVSLMFANNGYAEMRLIEEKKIESKEFVYLSVATICVDGYKFVISEHKVGTSIVQFFTRAVGGVSLPKKC